MIPMIANIVIFFLLSLLCQSTTGVVIPQLVLNLMKPLLSATDTVWAAFIYAADPEWTVGRWCARRHIVNSVMSAFLLINITANAEAYAVGQEMTAVLCSGWNNNGSTMAAAGWRWHWLLQP